MAAPKHPALRLIAALALSALVVAFFAMAASRWPASYLASADHRGAAPSQASADAAPFADRLAALVQRCRAAVAALSLDTGPPTPGEDAFLLVRCIEQGAAGSVDDFALRAESGTWALELDRIRYGARPAP